MEELGYNSESGENEFPLDPELVKAAQKEIQEISWIKWYTSLEGHEYLVEVDDVFIKDPFNLYGLQKIIGKNFANCVKTILSP